MDFSLDITHDEVTSLEDLRKKQIEYFKCALKLYRGARLTLEAINESMVSNIEVPEHLKTYEVLRAKIQDLQNEVIQLQCLEDMTRVIHNSVAASDMTHPANEEYKKKIEETVMGIVHFTRNILDMYNTKCNEIDRIEKSNQFVSILDALQGHLQRMKDSPRVTNSNMSEEELSKMEKVERKIEKINVMRTMKAILLAKYATNHERLPDLQELRTSNRRNLTKEDFSQSWNVGFRLD